VTMTAASARTTTMIRRTVASYIVVGFLGMESALTVHA
jgi:hypothetical protein